MNIAIMLSGGVGNRYGGNIPKQYIEIKGKRIIYYSLDSIVRSKFIDKICIVAHKEWQDVLNNEMDSQIKDKLLCYAEPGENRQLSILNGLQAIKHKIVNIMDDDLVFIQDAARPYLTEEMIKNYINAVEDHDGILPVLPMKDTVYMSEDGNTITSLLNRNTIFAGQAPEVFKFNKYLMANEVLLPEKIKMISGSTEPAILAGMDIILILGDENNIKITTQSDLNSLIRVGE